MSIHQTFRENFFSFGGAPRFALRRLFASVLLGVSLALARPCVANPFTFDATGSMISGTAEHTATLLQNGKVLVTGGSPGTKLSLLYDPATGIWTQTGSLLNGRYRPTATLLANGKVLLAGGTDTASGLGYSSAELYDPATGTWSTTGNMSHARSEHTATLLSDSLVLVAGGVDGNGGVTAELYDSSSGTWSDTGSLGLSRRYHTATLLPNGKVLVAGGDDPNAGGATATVKAELYDPAKRTWTATGNLIAARAIHTATLLPNGKVLVAGGHDTNGIASAELYNPSTATWAATGSLSAARSAHTATLLPDGKVLVAGGTTSSSTEEIYNPTSGTWAFTGSLITKRTGHSATLLHGGKVLVAGGLNVIGTTLLKEAELFDPSSGVWSATSAEGANRALHTATLLPGGQVLVAGGTSGSSARMSAELYSPETSQWTSTGNLNGARYRHTATLLANGKVLVAGGTSGGSVLATSELYDPSNGTWTATGNLKNSRYDHTATLLPDGRVLVTGGVRIVNFTTAYVATAELYDPATGLWTLTGSLHDARHNHTATLLSDGTVLVAGGSNGAGIAPAAQRPDATTDAFGTSELYNPATGTWTVEGNMNNARELHTATLLPNGKVLVVGGSNGSGFLTSAEVYSPSGGGWASVASLTTERAGHSATLLQSGRVLVYGGQNANEGALSSSQLYDPAINKWTLTGNPNIGRSHHTATLLTNGKVLGAGGYDGNGSPLSDAVLYDAGFAFLRPAWQPQISGIFLTATSQGAHLVVIGSLLQGISQASGGAAQDSATNYPVVQIRSVDNGQEAFLLANLSTGWSDQLFDAVPLTGFPYGPSLITVFVNGIPSDSYYLVIPAPPLPSTLGNISTRLRVLGGDNVLIAGMIASGNVSKKVIIRAIGPTLTDFGVPGALSDPTLELFQGNTSVATNDDWRSSSQQAEIQASGFAPTKDAESAIIFSLAPGTNYTAAVRGKNGETGVALVEVFDLDTAATSKLGNISTRGFVGVDDNVMIAGVIVSPPNGTDAKVLVRALGPTLADFGVAGALADPMVDLVNSSGTVLRSNDNWKSSQQAEIEAANLGPAHDQEAALIETIPPGQYTAVVRGKNSTTGVGLVEVYNIQ